MNVKDIGLFVNARYFEQVSAHDRTPDTLLDRVQETAALVTLAGGFSHKVVCADCGRDSERAIADELALAGGFRVRHCPAAGPDQSVVLGAEILEACATDPGPKTIVIGDSLADQAAVVDIVHRQRRSVIALVAEYPRQPRIADLTYTLPLAPEALLVVVREVIDAVRAGNGEPAGAAVYAGLCQRITGFQPGAYGYASMADLIGAAEGAGGPRPSAARNRIIESITKTRKSPKPKRAAPVVQRSTIRETIRELPGFADDQVHQMADHRIGARVLKLLEAHAELHPQLEAGELDFPDAVQHFLGDDAWKPRTSHWRIMMHRASLEAGGWLLATPPGTTRSQLVLGETVPEGWSFDDRYADKPGESTAPPSEGAAGSD
ncbi:hypothetical protein ACFRAQ_12870 [Nocardia sp. NPDC056611]|uniref:hypothetical protein n=1 Tax=Nocardia sp. NPDC056611 TaxID=3345877 RepID=UPI00366B23D4